MTLLDRYFGGKLVVALIRAMVALVLLFVLVDLLTHRREAIIKHEVPWSVVAYYYAAFTPQILYQFQVGALAMLVATLLVFGDAAQNNEVTAALAGGISLPRLVRAPIAVALLLTAAMFGLQETVGAAASQEALRLEERYFSHSKMNKRAAISWPKLKGDWTCYVLKFNRAALTGEHVFIHAIRDTEIEEIQARRIFWDETERAWFIEDGFWLSFDRTADWQKESRRITQCRAPFSETPEELFALEQPPQTKSAAALARDIRRARARGIPVDSQLVDFHAKFSQPLLSFVIVWLAIPFAIKIRRGGVAIGFGVSTAIALAYLVLFRLGMGLGYMGDLAPLPAAWLASAAFLVVGQVLFWRTAS